MQQQPRARNVGDDMCGLVANRQIFAFQKRLHRGTVQDFQPIRRIEPRPAIEIQPERSICPVAKATR